ncbi:SpaH/EbpB family LPXTG-anchored major pilin [Leucobacter sp. CSA2]|uniref:SpaH/EbpB family LPXTG-anchored major pilin n=1 Tax=Leucobacter edaphi TaxID=2796472 RepID=A0A934QD72_9MICO|nr:SpaH/EbpB family LPXTG-anchored major pilin [Leucobacter edaphi]
MNNPTIRRNRGIAAAAGAALALGSLGMLAGPAFAAPGDGGTGSITVYKLEQKDASIGPNDGTKLPDLGGAKPLVAGFTSCAVEGIDLSVSADWERLKDVTIAPDAAGGQPVVTEKGTTLALTNCVAEQKTDAGTGAATFADLPADKAYVVWESTPAEGAVAAAQPTLLTVPYTGTGADGNWNYNPHIYPKNVIVGSGATKDDKIIGDKVEWDVTVPINPLAAGNTYDEFRISDKLDTVITYTGGTVKLLAAGGTEVALDAADYTLSDPTGKGGDEVAFELTATGLAKLDANIGGKLILTIKADATGTGTTKNEAKITINGKSTEDGKGPSVVDPESFFAGAHIEKQAKYKGAQDLVPLAGAEFSVYPAADAATDCAATPAADTEPAFEKQVSDDQGNTPNMVLAEGKYCVYETKTPAGFKGLNGGMLLDVTGDNAAVKVLNTQVGADEGDLPSLPLTGSAGSIALFAAGGALLALGTAFVLVRRKNAHSGE